MGLLKAVVLVVVVLAGLLVLLVAGLYLRAVRRGRQAWAALVERVAPVAAALARGETPSAVHLTRYAEDRETRKALFEVLQGAGRADLFPAPFLEWELIAEADLVAWLVHPNELGAPPAEIELVERLKAPSGEGEYFVFRFRTHEPHWAAKDGWLAGVAGPYDIAGPRRFHGAATFSRFEAFDLHTPAEHLALVHDTVFPDGALPTPR